MNNEVIKIFLVDDDAVFLKSMEIELRRHADFIVKTFATGELCIKELSHNPDVIILDYFLDGSDKNAMNGIETLDKIKGLNPRTPVVMLSCQDKIEVAVNCMNHHAFDYVVKNAITFLNLKNVLTKIFQFHPTEKELIWYESVL